MDRNISDLSPSRQQFINLKKKYSEEILLVRVGDFYEAFDEDAKLISKMRKTRPNFVTGKQSLNRITGTLTQELIFKNRTSVSTYSCNKISINRKF